MHRAMPESEKPDAKITRIATEKLMAALNRADEIGGEVRDFIQDKMATDPRYIKARKAGRSSSGQDFESKDEVAAKAKAAEAKRAAVAALTPAAKVADPGRVRRSVDQGAGVRQAERSVERPCADDPRAREGRLRLGRRRGAGARGEARPARQRDQAAHVPFIYLRGQFIGGFNALAEIERLGQLEYALMSAEEREKVPAHARFEIVAAAEHRRDRSRRRNSELSWIAAVAGVAGPRPAGRAAVPTFWFILARDADLLRYRDLCASSMLAHADQLDDVLARNLAARGGAGQVRAIKSLRATGKVTLGGGSFSLNAEFSQIIDRPNRIRTEITIAGPDPDQRERRQRRLDGVIRSRVAAMPSARPSTTSVRSSKARSLDGPLVDWRTKGHRIEYLGTEDVDGTPAIKLRVTRKDGDVQYVYLDPDSCLEIRDRDGPQGPRDRADRRDRPRRIPASRWRVGAVLDRVRRPGAAAHAPSSIERVEPNVAVDDAAVPRSRTSFGDALDRRRSRRQGRRRAPRRRRRRRRPPVFDSGTISGLGTRNIGSATMSGRIAAVAARRRRSGKTDSSTSARRPAACGSRPTAARRSSRCSTSSRCSRSAPSRSIRRTRRRSGSAPARLDAQLRVDRRRHLQIDRRRRDLDEHGSAAFRAHHEDHRRSDATATPSTPACPASCGATAPIAASTKRPTAARPGRRCCQGANLSTGCSSVALDPKNPDVLFAACGISAARAGRSAPAAMARRADGSGLFRSTDGGKTWTPITDRRTRPARKSRGDVSRSRSRRRIANIVYAFIESKHSALFRSTTAARPGTSATRARSWSGVRSISRISSSIRPIRTACSSRTSALIVSDDGGKSFANDGGGSHGDWHDVWIDPSNPKHVFTGDDGGLWQSYDGGNRWWKANNLPVSQFYHVSVDDKDPYHVYGGLQDNARGSATRRIRAASPTRAGRTCAAATASGSFADPTDPERLRRNRRAATSAASTARRTASRDIQPKADYNEKLRFNWNTPIAREPERKRRRSTSARSSCSARAITATAGIASRRI